MGLSFSVTASVTLMRICLRLLLSAPASPHPHVFILTRTVLFGLKLDKSSKNAPDSPYNGAIYAKQLLIIYSIYLTLV